MIWLELMDYYLYKDDFILGWSIFQEGIDELQEQSLPLWDFMNMYVMNSEDEMVC